MLNKPMAPWRSDYFKGAAYVESTDPGYNYGCIITKLDGPNAERHASLIVEGVNHFLATRGLLVPHGDQGYPKPNW